MKKLILIIGAPGSGKTSTAKEVIKLHNNITHYSMGEIFREEIKRKTKAGKTIAQYLEKGVTVPIQTAVNAVSNIIKNTKNNIIIDGYPRDDEQLFEFDKFCKNQNQFEFAGIIEIKVSEEIAKQRILSRQRGEDDNERKFADRMKYYEKYREIIIQFYEQKNKYFSINGNTNFKTAADRLNNLICRIF